MDDAKRRGYEAEMRSRLDGQFAGLMGRKGRLAEVADDQKADCEGLIEEAPRLEKETRTRLRALGRAPDDAWPTLRESLGAMWMELAQLRQCLDPRIALWGCQGNLRANPRRLKPKRSVRSLLSVY